MRTWQCVALGLMTASWAASAGAQGKPKDKPSTEADTVFDNTKPKETENKAGEGDVVFDNVEAEPEEMELENAPTYATTTPDPVEKRRARFHPGFDISVRVGFALPGGRAEGDRVPLGDGVTGILGIGAVPGYRITPNLLVGLYVGAGYLFAKDCPAASSCSGWQVRGGPEVQWRFLPFHDVSPWVGLGFGYEYLRLSQSQGGASLSNSYRGFYMAELTAAVDFLASRAYAGPFVSLLFGKYTNYSVSGEGVTGNSVDESGSIDQTATHRWLTFGVHGTFE